MLGLRLLSSISPSLYLKLIANGLLEGGLPINHVVVDPPSRTSMIHFSKIGGKECSSSNLHNLVNIPCVSFSFTGLLEKPFWLGLFNAQSINKKALFVKDYLVEHGLDVLALTETWTKSESFCTFNELVSIKYQGLTREAALLDLFSKRA